MTEPEDSPAVVVGVVVVIEEAGGAVETERGGWEVGGTAEDEEDEGEGMADSVTVRRRGRGRKKGTPTDLRSSCKDSAEHTTTEHHSQVVVGERRVIGKWCNWQYSYGDFQ